MTSAQPRPKPASTSIRLAVGFGVYFAWVSIIHYGHNVGLQGHLGTALASSVSVISAAVFSAAFFIGRQDRGLNIGRNYRIAACAMAVVGTFCLTEESLRFFVPLLVGATVAWFRLAYAEYFATLGSRGTAGVLGGAFGASAVLFSAAQLVSPGVVLVGTALLPVAFTLLLPAPAIAAEPTHRKPHNVSTRGYWELAVLALVFSFIFDITEAHLFLGREEQSPVAVSVGFVVVALILSVIGYFALRQHRIDKSAYTAASIACALLAFTSFFLRPISASGFHLMVLQVVGGYSFVAVLLVSSAEIAKSRNVRAPMVFGLVLASQRVGNALGELAATGINAAWALSAAAYAVIGLLIAYALGAAFVVLLVRIPSRAGSDDADARTDVPQPEPMAWLRTEYGLSPREVEVLLLLAENHSTGEIERELHVSNNTVKTHTQRIYQKLGVHSKAELIELLGREG